ncbi:MAG: glycoside hydrolase family 97 catalytic domain-containing protein [Bacteroidales bacterium]|nr:glycoside hydrolase family 97 catalytic domain-containing protein [Bacteroidales bacterium]
MNKVFTSLALLLSSCLCSFADDVVSSPDGRLKVSVEYDKGSLALAASYDGRPVLLPSALGLKTTFGSYGDKIKSEPVRRMSEVLNIDYKLDRIKQSAVKKSANFLSVSLETSDGRPFVLEVVAEDNALAFRYVLLKKGETVGIRVEEELTEFRFPDGTTTFLSPQSDPMIGWKRTKPSYEEEYSTDRPMNEKSQYGRGYVFPCLFKIPAADKQPNIWALLSETGVDSRYCASHISDFKDGAYRIAYPMPEENNGDGSAIPGIALPAATPWRTLAVGTSPAVVAEQTITWDVVKPLFETTKNYDYGCGTWSWILWQDNSINMKDSKTFVDLAQSMGYKFVLIDSFWDRNIGRDGMRELAAYAAERGVKLFVWYSSSGYWNDIVQSPTNIMDRAISRKAEMKWLNELGVAGIKVDFFGGDKQETMRLYEDILSDANDHGLMVVFHGATLPRGWERMYPNYVGSEAVLASENLIFNQHYCDDEARITTLHPFIRNAVGCMEFGGSFMNKRMNRGNDGGNYRRTTDVFELAQAVLFQNPIQFFALAPNNLTDAPKVCMDFLRAVPTTWDETRIIDGYPGKYIVLARRHADKWYVAAVNAEKTPLSLNLNLEDFFGAGATVSLYSDDPKSGDVSLVSQKLPTKKGKSLKVSLPTGGGLVIVGLQK